MLKTGTNILQTILKENFSLAQKLETIFYKIPFAQSQLDKPVNIEKILENNLEAIKDIIKEIDTLLNLTKKNIFSSFKNDPYKKFIIPLRNQCKALKEYILFQNISYVSNKDFGRILSDIGNTTSDFIYSFSNNKEKDIKKALSIALKNIKTQKKQKLNLKTLIQFPKLKHSKQKNAKK